MQISHSERTGPGSRSCSLTIQQRGPCRRTVRTSAEGRPTSDVGICPHDSPESHRRPSCAMFQTAIVSLHL